MHGLATKGYLHKTASACVYSDMAHILRNCKLLATVRNRPPFAHRLSLCRTRGSIRRRQTYGPFRDTGLLPTVRFTNMPTFSGRVMLNFGGMCFTIFFAEIAAFTPVCPALSCFTMSLRVSSVSYIALCVLRRIFHRGLAKHHANLGICAIQRKTWRCCTGKKIHVCTNVGHAPAVGMANTTTARL